MIALAMTLDGVATAAQDHLAPEHSVYEGRAFQDDTLIGYDIDVVRKFEELFAGGFDARAIILPSFETEYAIGITREKDEPKLVGLRTHAKLWHYSVLREYDSERRPKSSRSGEKTNENMRELRASLPPTIEDVKLKRCEMPISAENRSRLTGLWRKMLFGVRYPPIGRLGLDGVSYHYSGDFDRLTFPGLTLAGQIWSPQKGTRLDRFTQMTEALYAACDAGDAGALAAAISDADAICKEVNCGER